MDGFSEFFAMGGYAGYVWPAYGAVAVVLAGMWIMSRRFLKATDREVKELDPRRRAQPGDTGP